MWTSRELNPGPSQSPLYTVRMRNHTPRPLARIDE